MKKTYRAAKYIRTSCTDDETEYRDSIANQSRVIDAFIQQHPEILGMSERVDNGYSGLFYDRPAFVEMISDIKAGRIDCVVVKDISRLGRNYIETGRYLRDFFPAHGVRFISIDDGFDSITAEGFERIITSIKSIFSEQYSRDVSIKTRTTMEAKRKRGEYVGAIPIYGYQRSLDNRHQLAPDSNTAPIVKTIYDMKLHGMSATAIATELNCLGVPSPLEYRRKEGLPHPTGGFADNVGACWSATTILRILKDENYTGTLVQGRQRNLNFKSRTMISVAESQWVKSKKAHPAIISLMDYDTVQRVLRLDTRTSPKQDRVHIFSGLLICGCCGGVMSRKIVPYAERQYIYYYCATGKRNGCDSSGRMSETALMRDVLRKVKEYIAHIERSVSYDAEYQLRKSLRDNYAREMASCEERIQAIRTFRTRLHDSEIRNIIGQYESNRLQAHYDAEIIHLEKEVSSIFKRLRSIDSDVEADCTRRQYVIQFAPLYDLNRAVIVRLVQRIHILKSKDIMIDFVYQPEYIQAIQYDKGGQAHGKEKPKTR